MLKMMLCAWLQGTATVRSDPIQLLHGIELFDRIAREIPFASLQCIDDISAAQVAYDYLKDV